MRVRLTVYERFAAAYIWSNYNDGETIERSHLRESMASRFPAQAVPAKWGEQRGDHLDGESTSSGTRTSRYLNNALKKLDEAGAVERQGALVVVLKDRTKLGKILGVKDGPVREARKRTQKREPDDVHPPEEPRDHDGLASGPRPVD